MCLETSKEGNRRTSLDNVHTVLKSVLLKFLESVIVQVEHGVSQSEWKEHDENVHCCQMNKGPGGCLMGPGQCRWYSLSKWLWFALSATDFSRTC